MRTRTPGHFTSSTPDFETMGEFYAEIHETLLAFADELGAAAFLDTAPALPGLVAIRGLSDAVRALDTIVEQGEGSTSEKKDCHFTRFREMREEWSTLEVLNPRFAPAHPAAHDPVMRRRPRLSWKGLASWDRALASWDCRGCGGQSTTPSCSFRNGHGGRTGRQSGDDVR